MTAFCDRHRFPEDRDDGVWVLRNGNFALRGTFLWGAVANFFFHINIACFFFLPLYIKGLGLGELVIGAVVGTIRIASVLVRPWVGKQVDLIGRKQIVVLGTIFTLASTLSMFFFRDLGVAFYLFRIIQGAGLAFFFTGMSTLIADIVPSHERGRWFGRYTLSGFVAIAVIPWLAEGLLHSAGFDAIFGLAAASSAVSLVAARRLGMGFAGGPALAEGPGEDQRRLVIAVLSMTAVCGAIHGVTITFLPVFLAGASSGSIGLFFAAFYGAAIGVRCFGGRLADSTDKRKVILGAFVLVGAGMVSTAVGVTRPMVAVAGILAGTGYGFIYPALFALMVDMTRPARMGRTLGWFTASFDVGVLVSALGFGGIAEHFGYRAMLFSAALLSAAAIPLCFTVAPRYPLPHPARGWTRRIGRVG